MAWSSLGTVKTSRTFVIKIHYTLDCSVFFLCISGKARRNSCGPGTVFNPASLSCEDQSKVRGSDQVMTVITVIIV